MSQNELFHDACEIIEQAQRWAYQAVNETLIKRNWLLGMLEFFQIILLIVLKINIYVYFCNKY